MIFYLKAFPGGQYCFEDPDDAVYAKSESGWIDSKLFLIWLNKIFIKFFFFPFMTCYFIHCGHKSHVTLEVVDLCRKHNIILFCLPLMPSKSLMCVSKDFSQVLRSPFECAF